MNSFDRKSSQITNQLNTQASAKVLKFKRSPRAAGELSHISNNTSLNTGGYTAGPIAGSISNKGENIYLTKIKSIDIASITKEVGK